MGSDYSGKPEATGYSREQSMASASSYPFPEGTARTFVPARYRLSDASPGYLSNCSVRKTLEHESGT